MPIVSRFLGIVIAMYWNDHAPAHFHAKYGEYEIVVHITTVSWRVDFRGEPCDMYRSGTSYIEMNSWTTGKGAVGKTRLLQ